MSDAWKEDRAIAAPRPSFVDSWGPADPDVNASPDDLTLIGVDPYFVTAINWETKRVRTAPDSIDRSRALKTIRDVRELVEPHDYWIRTVRHFLTGIAVTKGTVLIVDPENLVIEPNLSWIATTPPTLPQHEDMEREFRALVTEWQEQTGFWASPRRRYMHSAYQKIIGLGREVLPKLLRELRDNPDDWFWALASVAREDPAAGASHFDEAQRAWLEWGANRGLI